MFFSLPQELIHYVYALTTKFDDFLGKASIFHGILKHQGISHHSVPKAIRAHRLYFLTDILKILKKTSIFCNQVICGDSLLY